MIQRKLVATLRNLNEWYPFSVSLNKILDGGKFLKIQFIKKYLLNFGLQNHKTSF